MKVCSLFAMGDVFIPKSNLLRVDDELLQIIQKHDLKFCNFEGPIFSVGEPIKKAGPLLYQDVESIDYLAQIGFNIVSLANNHIYDYGNTGLKETIRTFKEKNIEYIGAGIDFNEACSFKVINISEMKIGFLSFCESQFGAYDSREEERAGYAWINHFSVNQLLIESKSTVDFLVVSVHAGLEGVPLPLPEWRERYRELCKLGADVVLGHHPHIAQGWEKYDNKLIFYSMGNSLFDYHNTNYWSTHGYGVSLSFKKNIPPNFCIIPLEIKNNRLKCCKDEEYFSYLNKLSDYLKDENNYNNLIKSQLVWQFNNVYLKYFENYVLNNNSDESLTIKNDLILYHLFKIESHRYLIERALKIKIENKFPIKCQGLDQFQLHGENVFKEIEKQPNKVQIYQGYYQLMKKWISNLQKNKNISDYLKSANVSLIAIYGVGELGRLLYNEIKESVNVKGFIDNFCKDNYINDVPIIRSEDVDSLGNIDAMIITPIHAANQIKLDLKKKGVAINLLVLSEIINQQYKG